MTTFRTEPIRVRKVEYGTEASFQKAILYACARMDAHVQKFNDSFSHGIPDLFLADFGWIELKIPGGQVKGSQIMWAKKFSGRPLPVILLFSDGRVYDLARVTPGRATKAWFELNEGARLDPLNSPILIA